MGYLAKAAASIQPDFEVIQLDHDRGMDVEAYHPVSNELMGSVRFHLDGMVAVIVRVHVAFQWRGRNVHDKIASYLESQGYQISYQLSDADSEKMLTA